MKNFKGKSDLLNTIFKEQGMNYDNIKGNILYLFKLSRLTRKEFCEKTGIYPGFMNTINDDSRRFSGDTLINIAKAFRTGVSSLLKYHFYQDKLERLPNKTIYSDRDLMSNHSHLKPWSHFFSAATMGYFNSKVHEIKDLKTGVYFITSEKYASEPRYYTIRKMDHVTGEIDTIGEFNALNKKEALKQFKEIKE
jgi:hypothetical protein